MLKEYLSDTQFAQIIYCMLQDENFKFKVSKILRDKDFLQYNSSDLKKLFWAIIFNRSEQITELKSVLNVSQNGIDKLGLLNLLSTKYAAFKFNKMLPELTRPKETKEDIQKLKKSLEYYLYIISMIDMPDFEKIISYENLNALKSLESLKKYSSGFKSLDEIIGGGFYAGRTYLFAGGTGQGKSAWLRTLAIHSALQKFKTLFITLEMSAVEVAYLVKKSGMPDEIFQYLIVIEDSDSNHNLLNSFIQIYKPQILYIDYLDEYAATDWEKMGEIIKLLRYYSKLYQIPIITASQLNRAGYNELLPEDLKITGIAGSFEKVKKSEFVGLIDLENQNFSIKVLKNRWGKSKITLRYRFNEEKLIIEEVK